METNDSNNLPPLEEEFFDFRKWMGKILSNWYWFVLTVGLFGGGSWIYTKYLVRTYQVQATMIVKTNKQAVGAEALYNSFNLGSGPSFPENEMQVLKSWKMARNTLNQLNFDVSYFAVGKWSESPLYGNVPFRVTLGPNSRSYIGVPIYVKLLSDSTYQLKINGHPDVDVDAIQKFHEAFVYKNFSFRLSPNPNFNIYAIPVVVRSDEYYFKVNNLDQLAYQYKGKVSADWVGKDGSVIQLSSTGFSAQMEVDYVNALMNEYIRWNLDQKNKIARNTIDFIDAQLAGMGDSLQLAEDNLTSFKAENRTADLNSEAQAIYDRLEQLDNDRRVFDMTIRYYDNLIKQLADSDDLSMLMDPSSMGISDPSLALAIAKLREMGGEKASLEISATERSTALIRLNINIQTAREDLSEIVKSKLKTAQNLKTELTRRIDLQNNKINKLPQTQQKLLKYQRTFEKVSEIHTFLSEKRAEAAISEASNEADQQIIDEARTDGVVKVSPDNYRNYTMGVLIGLLIPLLIIIMREITNNTIREREDIEKKTRIPVLGSIVHNKRNEILPVIKYGRSSIAESFRAIRTDLQFLLYKENSKVIMVTSTIANEGKSFISLNLGGIFSVAGKKTVVVGLDLRKPLIHSEVDIPNDAGVSTYIIGESKIEDIIFPLDHENLSIIPAGPVAPNPSELIETPEFATFIKELRSRFDIIILDTPPVAIITDASLIANHSDTVLYIVRQNYTRKSSMLFINRLAKKDHIKQLNIIINDVVVPKYYGYKYGYAYGYGYGKGHGSGYYVEK